MRIPRWSLPLVLLATLAQPASAQVRAGRYDIVPRGARTSSLVQEFRGNEFTIWLGDSPVVRGQYRMAADTLILTTTTGPCSGASSEGRYRVTSGSDGSMRLSRIDDRCAVRASNLSDALLRPVGGGG